MIYGWELRIILRPGGQWLHEAAQNCCSQGLAWVLVSIRTCSQPIPRGDGLQRECLPASGLRRYRSDTDERSRSRTCLMKPLGLLLPIVVAVALIGLPSIGEAQVQRPARVVDGAHRGYLAVRLLGGGEHEVIDELNADRLFVPASVLKVVTVAAVLEHLGTEYRWLTRLRSNGAIAGAVLDGDLVIEPGADPTWGAAFF